MKKIIYTLIILFIATYNVVAQQENHYTMFMYNVQYLNPGYAGSRGMPSLTALYRNQWIGFKGAPISQVLSFSSPLFGKRAGIGANFQHHTIGVMNNWFGNINYSYALVNKKDFTLRAGIQASLKQYKIDFDNTANVIWDSGDPSIVSNDQAMEKKINFGAGLYATYKNSYVGISSPNIYNNVIGFNPQSGQMAEEQPHIYLMGGLQIPISSKLALRPSILAKYTKNAPFDMDANMSLIINNRILTGLSYRLGGSGYGESADFIVFFQATHQLGIGAAYDITLSKLKSYNSGSIELMARYDFGNNKSNLSNPRYFQ